MSRTIKTINRYPKPVNCRRPIPLRSVDRLLGFLSQTMGNMDQATAHFEDALAFCRKAGYRPELAWTCCDYSEALLQRNAAGDQAKAVSLMEEGLAISMELGMRPLIERIQAGDIEGVAVSKTKSLWRD